MNTRELLDRMAENLSVRRSFGAAYEREGLLIIPVALVAGGGGGGEGPMRPPATGHARAIETAEPANGAPPDSQPPIGTGGGFGGLVLPVGVYVVKGDQVRSDREEASGTVASSAALQQAHENSYDAETRQDDQGRVVCWDPDVSDQMDARESGPLTGVSS